MPGDERVLHRVAEPPGERLEVTRLERLVAEEHDEVLQPGPPDRGDGLVGRFARQVDAGDLRAEAARDRQHLEGAGGDVAHEKETSAEREDDYHLVEPADRGPRCRPTTSDDDGADDAGGARDPARPPQAHRRRTTPATRCSRPRGAAACGHRRRARPATARRAWPTSTPGRSACWRTTPSRPRTSTTASCSTCQSIPTSADIVVNYDF